MLRKTAEWKWTDVCQAAFDKAKETLVTVPVLAQPDFNLFFEVIADACGFGIGAVLLQEGRPITFESRGMTSAECNYHIGEQELLGVVHAMRTWRCYLGGAKQVTVVTDHNSITYLQTQPVLSRRQARWSEYLQTFKFKWLYRPGRCNVADPLSRLPVQGACETAVMSALGVERALHVMTRGQTKSGQAGQGVEQHRHAAEADHDMHDSDTDADVDVVMESADSVDHEHSEPVSLGAESDLKARVRAAYVGDPSFADGDFIKGLTRKDGLWFAGQALAVPKVANLRQECMQEMHDTPFSGHMGGD